MDNRAKILDIAMNLTRVGNWAADGYDAKKKRIETFLDNTAASIDTLDTAQLSDRFRRTYARFLREYKDLDKEGRAGPHDIPDWAERIMTWGTILTHRARLA